MTSVPPVAPTADDPAALVALLRELVEIESPTGTPGVAAASAWTRARLEALGGTTVLEDGGHLQVDFPGGGAPLVLHGPFNGAILVALVDSLGPSHLIAPGALLGPLSESGLLDGPRLVSVTLMGRCASPHDMADHPRPLLARPTRGPALIDLLAIGEQAAIAQVRQRDGAPAPIGATTHALSIDGANITAVSFERNARSNGGEDSWRNTK